MFNLSRVGTSLDFEIRNYVNDAIHVLVDIGVEMGTRGKGRCLKIFGDRNNKCCFHLGI